jgi:hypothetical protein
MADIGEKIAGGAARFLSGFGSNFTSRLENPGGLMGSTGKVAGFTVKGAARGAYDLAMSAPTIAKNADRMFLNKADRSFSNILGRTPKPWLMGALAVGTFMATANYGEQIYARSQSMNQGGAARQQSLGYDGIQPLADDLNSTGIVQALHKNRHG